VLQHAGHERVCFSMLAMGVCASACWPWACASACWPWACVLQHAGHGRVCFNMLAMGSMKCQPSLIHTFCRFIGSSENLVHVDLHLAASAAPRGTLTAPGNITLRNYVASAHVCHTSRCRCPSTFVTYAHARKCIHVRISILAGMHT
jgi:hypothetical protein